MGLSFQPTWSTEALVDNSKFDADSQKKLD